MAALILEKNVPKDYSEQWKIQQADRTQLAPLKFLLDRLKKVFGSQDRHTFLSISNNCLKQTKQLTMQLRTLLDIELRVTAALGTKELRVEYTKNICLTLAQVKTLLSENEQYSIQVIVLRGKCIMQSGRYINPL